MTSYDAIAIACMHVLLDIDIRACMLDRHKTYIYVQQLAHFSCSVQ